MAWIEVYDTLPDHPKVMRLSACLSMDKDAVVGKLVRLWTWAINNRESGQFTGLDESIIAEVTRYKGEPHVLLDALVSSGLMDCNEAGYCIHDWDEHVSMLLEGRKKKRAQTRERVRKYRERQALIATEAAAKAAAEAAAGASTRNALQERNVTQKSNACNAATVPYHTVYISPYNPPKGEASLYRFDEFWDAYPKVKHKGKKVAQAAWKKLNPGDELIGVILSAIKAQEQTQDWQKGNGQYIPYPATWLNGRRWEDEVAPIIKTAHIPPSEISDELLEIYRQ